MLLFLWCLSIWLNAATIQSKKMINKTDGERFGGHSQRDQSLQSDHEVRGARWVLAYRLNRPFHQGQQGQVVPTCTHGEKALDVKQARKLITFFYEFKDILYCPHSLSRRSTRSSSSLISRLTLEQRTTAFRHSLKIISGMRHFNSSDQHII